MRDSLLYTTGWTSGSRGLSVSFMSGTSHEPLYRLHHELMTYGRDMSHGPYGSAEVRGGTSCPGLGISSVGVTPVALTGLRHPVSADSIRDEPEVASL